MNCIYNTIISYLNEQKDDKCSNMTVEFLNHIDTIEKEFICNNITEQSITQIIAVLNTAYTHPVFSDYATIRKSIHKLQLIKQKNIMNRR